MTTTYQAPTVKKAFSILRALAGSHDGMGISRLSQKLEISKSTVHGVVGALEAVGAVRRDATNKKYSLGLTLFELGRSVYNQLDLKEIARPVLEALMGKTGESVFLGIRNGDHVTILDLVRPSLDLKITASLGMTVPLLAGALGKVFLAASGMKNAEAIIQSNPLPKFTDRTITDPELYLEAVQKTMNKGYGLDDEEYLIGVRATAAAITNNGYVEPAAIWVVGFKSGIDRLKLKRLALETKRAAETISHRLSHPDQPLGGATT